MKRKYESLVRRAEDMGIEYVRDLGEIVGLTPQSISSRLNGRSGWQPDEVVKLCQALDIPQEEVGKYFYPELENREKEKTIHFDRSALAL